MLLISKQAKKLTVPANRQGFAGGKGYNDLAKRPKLLASWSSEEGNVMLEQIWNTEGSRGITHHSPELVTILSGRAFLLPPKEWCRIYLPYKIMMQGGVTLTSGLQRVSMIEFLAIKGGGHLRVNAWNLTDEIIYLTPKTTMVNVRGKKIVIWYLGQDRQVIKTISLKELYCSEKFHGEIVSKHPLVGDFSTRPINYEMEELKVQASEVNWREPGESETWTHYLVETISDRRLVDTQLKDYMCRGYLYVNSV